MTRYFTKDNDTVQFEMGTQVMISDPCYKKEADYNRCQLVVGTVPGQWAARVDLSDEGVWGVRVAALSAWSLDHAGLVYPVLAVDGEVCVDSGQMSIVSLDAYEGSNKGFGDPGTFYGDACELTLAEGAFGGLLKSGRGVVSSSGFGDGGYRVMMRRNPEGAAIWICVFFIEGDDDGNDW